MVRPYAAALAAVCILSFTACGTFAPPQAAVTTAPAATETITETTIPTVTTVPETTAEPENTAVATLSEEEKKQLEANTFIAEFFDSAISFEERSDITEEALKDCTFEHEEESTNGLQRITLKGNNGSGSIDVLCIDITDGELGYDAGYMTENFGDYYHGCTIASMHGVTADDFKTNYRMTNKVVSKAKYQQYGSVQRSDGMANQFGYAETYAVLVNNKLTLVSGQFLSTDMMERQSFSALMTLLREKIIF